MADTRDRDSSGSEERSGTAFEYALAMSLQESTSAKIVTGNALDRTQDKYSQLAPGKRNQLTRCADRAAAYLITVDKRLASNADMSIEFNSSRNAQAHHDVRDIIVHSGRFTIGISCKVNNLDLRHSRLSGAVDFVKEWGLKNTGASPAYWQGITPIFHKLSQMRSQGLRWDDVYPGDSKQRNLNKLNGVVAPVLDAWERELVRLIAADNSLAPKLTRYLLGSKSYWKVVARVPQLESRSSTVNVQRFNLEGDMPGQALVMPSKVIGCAIKVGSSSRERLVTCDNNFTFGFRLHTAESDVVPSLKFAVKGRRLPEELGGMSLKV